MPNGTQRPTRGKLNSHAWIENRPDFAVVGVRQEILAETLLDLLMLSRSRIIVGQFMGNMPRLALLMRVSSPSRLARTEEGQFEQYPAACTYVSLDNRTLCFGSSFCSSRRRPNDPATAAARYLDTNTTSF